VSNKISISIGFTGSRNGMSKEQKDSVQKVLEKYNNYTIKVTMVIVLVQILIFIIYALNTDIK
jgi:hypothetical protein